MSSTVTDGLQLLTAHQGRVAGDTHPGLLPVHVRQPALEAAARRTEHLRVETHVNTRTHTLMHPFLLPACISDHRDWFTADGKMVLILTSSQPHQV